MRDIGFLLYDGIQALDFVGPYEALFEASQENQVPAYRLRTVSRDGGPVRSETGLVVHADLAVGDAPVFHTFIVPGGAGARSGATDSGLLDEIRRQAAGAERLVGICTGAFLLAEAGVLSGRRVTTHWRYARDLATAYAEVSVEADNLYLFDGDVCTSAGVLSGIDLTLALIEQDLGAGVAGAVARSLVVYLRRSGGQAQFSRTLRAQGRTNARFAAMADWARENLATGLDVDTLAAQAGFSSRHFQRVLHRDLGVTPARFIEDIRLDVARDLLAAGSGSMKQIAAAVGFAGDDAFRRAFRRRFDLSPADWRDRFRTLPSSPSSSSPPSPSE